MTPKLKRADEITQYPEIDFWDRIFDMLNALEQPTPDEVRDARKSAWLSQEEAANLEHVSISSWQRLEAPSEIKNSQAIPLASWELFFVKVVLASNQK